MARPTKETTTVNVPYAQVVAREGRYMHAKPTKRTSPRFTKMAEDAKRIDVHLRNGGKLNELSGITPIVPKGLSDLSRRE